MHRCYIIFYSRKYRALKKPQYDITGRTAFVNSLQCLYILLAAVHSADGQLLRRLIYCLLITSKVVYNLIYNCRIYTYGAYLYV